MRRLAYVIAALLVQVGIFSTRWNVVIGGQLFSKSLRGLTVYKLRGRRRRGPSVRDRLPDPAVRDPLRAGQGAAALGRGADLGGPAGTRRGVGGPVPEDTWAGAYGWLGKNVLVLSPAGARIGRG